MRFIILILALVLHIVCGQYHSSSASVGVNFENISPPHLSGGAIASSQSQQERPRNRRMYAMCPPNFQRVGTECFSLPQQQGSWLEAHFFCKDKNARLAEPEKYADRKLREFLLKYDAQTRNADPIWIGATYDWINKMWQWSISGRNLTYDDFIQKHPEQTLENHCAVFDPQLKYRWSSRTCVDKHRFICQHKMPKVSEKNRHKVYHRWNATYPNQLANEVILEVIDRKGKGRYNRRVIADGSNEEMVVPTRPGTHNRRRRPRPQHPQQSANLPGDNDVNYAPPQPSTHPNDIQQHYNPTRHPRFRTTTLYPYTSNTNDNEIIAPHDVITPVPDNVEKNVNPRRRTQMDRKLQRQREKELRRLQRKRERQEKMRREKQERMKKQREQREQEKRRMREEKLRQRQLQQQQQQQQKELDEIRQRENEAAQQRQQREQQLQEQQQQREKQLQEQQQLYKKQEIEELKKQKQEEERKRLEDAEEERRRQAYLEKMREQEEQDRANKEEIRRQEYERKQEEERKQQDERKQLEESRRKEYAERLKQAEDERARQLAEEQERKRLEDEENRRVMEEEEKQRQSEQKKHLDEEEERLRLQRLEEERRVEEQELARMREEQMKRAEIQRKRDEEIKRLEEEQKRIEQEEARIKDELEEAERQSRLQQEQEERRAEDEAKAREAERKRLEEKEARERLDKLEHAKRHEEARGEESKNEVSKNLRNRLSHLSPELRKQYIEERIQRKKEKEMARQAGRTNDAA